MLDQRVACDWGIDSTAQEDRCGVCHGDGTQCNTIRGNYTEPDGIDYIEMVVIPKGARNIRLVEADEAANYIAIQSVETNEYYLNGQWYTPNLIHFFFFDSNTQSKIDNKPIKTTRRNERIS